MTVHTRPHHSPSRAARVQVNTSRAKLATRIVIPASKMQCNAAAGGGKVSIRQREITSVIIPDRAGSVPLDNVPRPDEPRTLRQVSVDTAGCIVMVTQVNSSDHRGARFPVCQGPVETRFVDQPRRSQTLGRRAVVSSLGSWRVAAAPQLHCRGQAEGRVRVRQGA